MTHVGRMASPIATSAINRLGQYASSPFHRAYCYAELSVSSPVVAKTIATTHCAYPLSQTAAYDGRPNLYLFCIFLLLYFTAEMSVKHGIHLL